MTKYMEQNWPYISGTHGMRTEVMNLFTDADLTYSPGGAAMTLGALCREMGDVERSYIDSLRHHKQDWSYHNTAPGIETSIAMLKAWYVDLDKELESVVSGLTEADFQTLINRGGFQPTTFVQLEIYLQALLIFLGKVSIYARALNKSLSSDFIAWIG
jgi:hypothetical protein